MCGGEGTRLRPDYDTEKPLVDVGGTPMVDRVLDALAASSVDDVAAVVSPQTPATRDHLAGRSATIVDAPGEGYVADLQYALDGVETPVLTVVADLPLLEPVLVDRTLAVAGGESLTVVVPAALKRRLDASVDAAFERAGREFAPTGLNVVGDADDATYVSYDARLAVNVNRPPDVDLATALCA
ncbi:MAG: NTP transferase domain-containing protein [Haloferacaceae archaeon]